MLKQFLCNSDVHTCKGVWLISALSRMQRDLLSLKEGGTTQKFKICFSFHPRLMRLKKLSQKIFISDILVIPMIYFVWRKNIFNVYS